jgi:hypothetical protein
MRPQQRVRLNRSLTRSKTRFRVPSIALRAAVDRPGAGVAAIVTGEGQAVCPGTG